MYFRCSLTNADSRQIIAFLDLGCTGANAACHCCKGTLLMPVHLYTRTPRPTSAELLPSCTLVPTLCRYMRLFVSRCRTLHVVLLNFMRFLSASSSNQLRSFCLLLPAYFQGVRFFTSCRLLMEVLNCIGPSIDPQGTLPVTSTKETQVVAGQSLFHSWQSSQFFTYLAGHLPIPYLTSLA